MCIPKEELDKAKEERIAKLMSSGAYAPGIDALWIGKVLAANGMGFHSEEKCRKLAEEINVKINSLL